MGGTLTSFTHLCFQSVLEVLDSVCQVDLLQHPPQRLVVVLTEGVKVAAQTPSKNKGVLQVHKFEGAILSSCHLRDD